jgi:hypothetical protein
MCFWNYILQRSGKRKIVSVEKNARQPSRVFSSMQEEDISHRAL